MFNLSHGALANAKLRPPRTFREAKITDEMARKACELDQLDDRSQALLIHINDLNDDPDAQPIEASVIDAELSPARLLPLRKTATRLMAQGCRTPSECFENRSFAIFGNRFVVI